MLFGAQKKEKKNWLPLFQRRISKKLFNVDNSEKQAIPALGSLLSRSIQVFSQNALFCALFHSLYIGGGPKCSCHI
jgi:hypothetical protein